jgi:hypothetical protein
VERVEAADEPPPEPAGGLLQIELAPPAPAGGALLQIDNLVAAAPVAAPPPEPSPVAGEQEHCDLCSRPVPPEHRHLLDLRDRELQCACRACALLFDRPGTDTGHHLLVPERRLRLDGFELDDALWAELQLPVDLAFFLYEREAGKVRAYYPSPMGPTESLLEVRAWDELVDRNAVLESLEPDVEALLVNRSRDAREHFLVPVDDCYALVGLIRTRWRGFSGGREVWEGIAQFFERLDHRATAVRGTARSG